MDLPSAMCARKNRERSEGISLYSTHAPARAGRREAEKQGRGKENSQPERMRKADEGKSLYI